MAEEGRRVKAGRLAESRPSRERKTQGSADVEAITSTPESG
jgi:hypothetical protein